MEAREEEIKPTPELGVVHSVWKKQIGNQSQAFSLEEWGQAQQRLILYLQFLRVPPFEALELALEALRIARQSQAPAGQNRPVSEAMAALRQLVIQRQVAPFGTAVSGAWPGNRFLQLPDLENDDISMGIKSMPPLNRGVMVPER